MQYVDKGSVVPPPFNLLPSGKYFIEFCKRCYDRIKSEKVRQTWTLYMLRFFYLVLSIENLTCSIGVARGQCYHNYSMLCFFVVK